MENQINVGNQNTQQIGQNSTNQLPAVPPVPEKPKLNYRMISTIVLLVVIMLTGVVFFFKSSKQSRSIQSTNVEPTSTLTKTNETSSLSTNGQLVGELAFIRGDNVWISNNGVEKQLTTDAIPTEIPYRTGLPKLWYSNPQISPDGKKVAYLKNTNTNTDTDARALVVSDIDGKNMKQLVDDVEWMMPIIQWSNNSQQIYYPSSGGVESIIVKSVDAATSQKQEYGQFAMGSGCGGASPDPAHHISTGENINSGGGGVEIFNLSPQNSFIVHTIHCTGSGLGILDLSAKQDKKLDDKAMRAAVSPDGKNIAAISGNDLVIFDGNGKVLKTYQTPDVPQILLWDTAGKTIYYSSSKLVKNLDFDDKLSSDILGSSPASYRVNASTLWKLELDSGKSEKIIDFDAHNIKPVFVANQKLLVVVVENATALYDYINKYKTKDNMVQYYPKVKLAEVNLSALTSTVLAEQVQQSSYLPQ